MFDFFKSETNNNNENNKKRGRDENENENTFENKKAKMEIKTEDFGSGGAALLGATNGMNGAMVMVNPGENQTR